MILKFKQILPFFKITKSTFLLIYENYFNHMTYSFIIFS